MTATGTKAVEFQTVGLNAEAVACGNFLLEFLDFAVFKFHDLAATRANKVIVMALMRHIVVLGLGAKMACLRDARVAKQIQCPIDRGEP